MVDERILEYEEKSGKGGYHRIYYPKMDREEFAVCARDERGDHQNALAPGVIQPIGSGPVFNSTRVKI